MVMWAQGRLGTFLKFRYNVAAGIHYSRSYLHTCGVCGCVRPYQRASMLSPHHHLPAVRPSRSCNQSHIKTNKASLSRGYPSLPLYYSRLHECKTEMRRPRDWQLDTRPSVFPCGVWFLTCRPSDGGRSIVLLLFLRFPKSAPYDVINGTASSQTCGERTRCGVFLCSFVFFPDHHHPLSSSINLYSKM